MLHDLVINGSADIASRVLLSGGVALLVFATVHDIAFRTIPNSVSVGLAIVGLSQRAVGHEVPASLLTATLLFAAGIVCWLLNWLGGGDVKLLAAASALVAPRLIFNLLFFVSLAGGLLAILYLALSAIVPPPPARRPSSFTARIVRAEQWRILRRGPIPYASAITAGVLCTLVSG